MITQMIIIMIIIIILGNLNRNRVVVIRCKLLINYDDTFS